MRVRSDTAFRARPQARRVSARRSRPVPRARAPLTRACESFDPSLEGMGLHRHPVIGREVDREQLAAPRGVFVRLRIRLEPQYGVELFEALDLPAVDADNDVAGL